MQRSSFCSDDKTRRELVTDDGYLTVTTTITVTAKATRDTAAPRATGLTFRALSFVACRVVGCGGDIRSFATTRNAQAGKIASYATQIRCRTIMSLSIPSTTTKVPTVQSFSA